MSRLGIVNRLIRELSDQLKRKKVILKVDENARLWLAEHGYDRKMGARPMKRLIQERIKRPLADELLFGRLVNGGAVSVSATESELLLNVQAQEAEREKVTVDDEVQRD